LIRLFCLNIRKLLFYTSKMKKRSIYSLIGLAFFLLLSERSRAQVDAQFSQYFDVLNYYNPAAAGKDNVLRVSGIDRMQWVGVRNAPQSFFFSVDTPFKLFNRKQGVGICFFNESIGLFTNRSFSLQYALKIKLFGGELSIGPQLGFFDQGFDASKIYIPSSEYHQSSEDGIPTSSGQGMTFDAALGAFYTHKNYYVGLSTTHMMESTIQLDSKTTTYLPRAFYFLGGCNIPLKKSLIDLQPSLMVKSDLITTQLDVTLRGWFNKRFSGGLTWRPGDAVVVLLGAKIKSIQVGYSYDISISTMAGASNGSHELGMSYCFDLKNLNNSKNKHKSVRIL